jgi:adenylosuccinate synthase
LFAVQTVPLPAYLHPRYCFPVIGAGGLVNLGVLQLEMMLLKGVFANVYNEPIEPWTEMLYLDEQTMVVDHDHELEERSTELDASIGSTTEGVGAALAAKIRRQPGIKTGCRSTPPATTRSVRPASVAQQASLQTSVCPRSQPVTTGRLASFVRSRFV